MIASDDDGCEDFTDHHAPRLADPASDTLLLASSATPLVCSSSSGSDWQGPSARTPITSPMGRNAVRGGAQMQHLRRLEAGAAGSAGAVVVTGGGLNQAAPEAHALRSGAQDAQLGSASSWPSDLFTAAQLQPQPQVQPSGSGGAGGSLTSGSGGAVIGQQRGRKRQWVCIIDQGQHHHYHWPADCGSVQASGG